MAMVSQKKCKPKFLKLLIWALRLVSSSPSTNFDITSVRFCPHAAFCKTLSLNLLAYIWRWTYTDIHVHIPNTEHFSNLPCQFFMYIQSFSLLSTESDISYLMLSESHLPKLLCAILVCSPLANCCILIRMILNKISGTIFETYGPFYQYQTKGSIYLKRVSNSNKFCLPILRTCTFSFLLDSWQSGELYEGCQLRYY